MSEPTARDLLAGFPDGPELLQDVVGFESPGDHESDDQFTPTITTITTVTVAC